MVISFMIFALLYYQFTPPTQTKSICDIWLEHGQNSAHSIELLPFTSKKTRVLSRCLPDSMICSTINIQPDYPSRTPQVVLVASGHIHPKFHATNTTMALYNAENISSDYLDQQHPGRKKVSRHQRPRVSEEHP